MAVAVAAVDERAAVRRERGVGLGCCGVSQLACCGVFVDSDEYLTTADECYLLAVAGDGGARGTTRCECGYDILIVACDADSETLRPGSLLLDVYVAVIGIAERVVTAYGEEADRIVPIGCHGSRLRGVHGREAIDIERSAITLREEIDSLAVGCDDRVAVFSRALCDVCVLACLEVVEPDVTCDA